jgi:hypothetical protein
MMEEGFSIIWLSNAFQPMGKFFHKHATEFLSLDAAQGMGGSKLFPDLANNNGGSVCLVHEWSMGGPA